MERKPTWLHEAEKYTGLKEIPGLKHESRILNMWQAIKMGGVKDDETPWCAAFVGTCLEKVGIKSTRSGWARSYLNWGIALPRPAYGCIVVFSRQGGGGHVGFVVGVDQTGRILVLGGNQENGVDVKPFETARETTRVLGYRWPSNITYPLLTVATVSNTDSNSTSEA